MGLAFSAKFNNIKEIIIVIDNDEASTDRDVLFFEPTLAPFRMLKRIYDSELANWEKVAARKVKILQDFKASRAEARQKILD